MHRTCPCPKAPSRPGSSSFSFGAPFSSGLQPVYELQMIDVRFRVYCFKVLWLNPKPKTLLCHVCSSAEEGEGRCRGAGDAAAESLPEEGAAGHPVFDPALRPPGIIAGAVRCAPSALNWYPHVPSCEQQAGAQSLMFHSITQLLPSVGTHPS